MLANFALTYKSSEKLDYILRKITRGPSLDVCSGLIVLFLNIHWVDYCKLCQTLSKMPTYLTTGTVVSILAL